MNRPTLSALIGICGLATLICVSSLQADTHYVRLGSPSPTTPYTSWDTASHSVQAAIDAAVAGDEVWVSAGTYIERITLREGVSVYGAFPATGNPTWESRDMLTYVSSLDGNKQGSVVTAPTGVTTATVIDGFAITNGIGTVVSNYRYGGGVYCSSSSPTITNNRIQYNSAYQGGGIYTSSGSPTIKNNKILSNMGGGILTGSYSSAIVSNNDISGNGGAARGGGIHCFASAALTNNIVTNNSSTMTGGGICLWNNPTVSNNTVAGNSAVYDGGGLYCINSTGALSNNIVAFNSSGIYREGTRYASTD